MEKRKYRFSYQTIVSYGSMVNTYHFLLRCTPCSLPCQTIEEQSLHLLAPTTTKEDVDSFGNTIHYGYLNSSHDLFVVASNGTVTCSKYQIEDAAPQPFYLSSTHLTQPSAAISKFNKGVDATGSNLDIALALSSELHRTMDYNTELTTVATSACESFDLGGGVCQDFSHILVAMCRERGVLARYVVGFVVGTGQTHAWVEVWSDGVWYGVDPTHDRLIEYDYIKLAHGRDAADCSVIRGVSRGATSQAIQIRVVVEPLL